MRAFAPPAIAVALAVVVSHALAAPVAQGSRVSAPAVQAPAPPTVTLRDIAHAPRVARGTSISLETSVTLFLPDGWRDEIATPTGSLKLTVHFHSAQWFAVEEHARRGARNPIVAAYYGEGSTVYQRPFLDPGHLDAMLSTVTAELLRHGAPPGTHPGPIELQSFSAGYGAVREILKSPVNSRRISAVVLADSLYASRTTDSLGRAVPDPAQMASFIDFARMAARGEKQMLVAHTTIVTPTYCSTVETADALIQALGGTREAVTTGSLAAATEGTSFPLTSRCDIGAFHVWGYEGRTGHAHMAVARTIADFWSALGR
jgi:hypothetical protein